MKKCLVPLTLVLSLLISLPLYSHPEIFEDGRAVYDVELLRFQYNETIDQTSDDIIILQGVGGIADTDLTIDLDGVGPVLYSTTDSIITIDDSLTITGSFISGAMTNSGDYTLDDGVGDSPALIWVDADDKTMTMKKLDTGNFDMTTTEGSITLNPATGVVLGTGKTFTVGSTQWSSGDGIDGEVVANDTIDDDSIDLSTGDGLSASDFPNEDLGDVSISSGTWSIDADTVALTTDTTGNYANGDGEAGSALTGDAALDFFGAGVTAVTDATTCTDIEGTDLSITTGTLNNGSTLETVTGRGASSSNAITMSNSLDLTGELDIDFNVNTEEMDVTTSAADYAADSAVVTIYNGAAAGQTNNMFLLRLRHKANADAQEQFLICEDNDGTDKLEIRDTGQLWAGSGIDSAGHIKIADDWKIQIGSLPNTQLYWEPNSTEDDFLATTIRRDNADASSAWFISNYMSPNGTTDHNDYVSPTFILANNEGADANDYAGVVIGERTQADVAVAHYFDFYAMTGAQDTAVDATTTEIGATFRTGDSGTGTPGSATGPGDWLFEDDVEIDGVLYTDGVISLADGAAATPQIFFRSDPDTGFYYNSDRTIGWAVAGGAMGYFSDRVWSTGGLIIGTNQAANVLSTATLGASSTTMYIGNKTINTTFTGFHYYQLGDLDLESGELVKLVDGKIYRSIDQMDKSVIGLYQGVTDFKDSMGNEYVELKSIDIDKNENYVNKKDGKKAKVGDFTYSVACIGDSYSIHDTYELQGAWVTVEAGNIENGDYLCSSDKDGYLEKQVDDVLHSYTVAKARENITKDTKTAYVYLLQ